MTGPAGNDGASSGVRATPFPDRQEMQMVTGQVKWFDNRKGWGFITHSDGQDVFVHYRNITGDGFRKLKDGQQVEFELVEGEKGPFAENVRPIA
jgi:CspA family cold shock protein